jgi:hypothetical protein
MMAKSDSSKGLLAEEAINFSSRLNPRHLGSDGAWMSVLRDSQLSTLLPSNPTATVDFVAVSRKVRLLIRLFSIIVVLVYRWSMPEIYLPGGKRFYAKNDAIKIGNMDFIFNDRNQF